MSKKGHNSSEVNKQLSESDSLQAMCRYQQHVKYSLFCLWKYGSESKFVS